MWVMSEGRFFVLCILVIMTGVDFLLWLLCGWFLTAQIVSSAELQVDDARKKGTVTDEQEAARYRFIQQCILSLILAVVLMLIAAWLAS